MAVFSAFPVEVGVKKERLVQEELSLQQVLEGIHPGKISESAGLVQLSKREEIQSVKLLKLLPFQVVACFAT